MKEKELIVDNEMQQVILFAEKEDESYAPVKSGSYLVKHFLDDFFLKKNNLDKKQREEIQKGNISPVLYYLLMQDMGHGDLAKRVGISKRKLRKHFRPDVFAKLDDGTLQKYAEIFGVSVEKIKDINN